MKSRLLLSVFFALAATVLVIRPAAADIYSFKDERGVVHFTNIKGLDSRYKLIRKEGQSRHAVHRLGQPPPAPTCPPRTEIEYATRPSWRPRARTYGVEPSLVHAVISAESAYNPNAVSRTGAMGLMQLMPDTARRYGVQNMMDPTENIHGGVKYLKDLMTLFQGDLKLVAAAYNAGENAVIRSGHKIPPYAETRHYVPKVLGFYHTFQKAQS